MARGRAASLSSKARQNDHLIGRTQVCTSPASRWGGSGRSQYCERPGSPFRGSGSAMAASAKQMPRSREPGGCRDQAPPHHHVADRRVACESWASDWAISYSPPNVPRQPARTHGFQFPLESVPLVIHGTCSSANSAAKLLQRMKRYCEAAVLGGTPTAAATCSSERQPAPDLHHDDLSLNLWQFTQHSLDPAFRSARSG